ncbi:uncharacterized protein CEXT_575611 [Caerostris extrusa]|uniref:Uncharacterized protein n=1 Tax=Caerostris extrusa TaxID=172846 RepID=A0AAV4XVB4_CAEEX|nr:uncharacterized protein CEXT_575611 [Caerostris extrusa]
MTIGHTVDMEQITQNEFVSQWETWPDTRNNMTSFNDGNTRSESESDSQLAQSDGANHEDFLKTWYLRYENLKEFVFHLLALLRKFIQTAIYHAATYVILSIFVFIKSDTKEQEPSRISSNRLAMDPKAILAEPDLGIIEDNPSNWEDNENVDELWDPDNLIREKKRAEQERRRADHERRKLEKENRKLSKPESLSSLMLSLSDSKDKHKYS